MCERITDADGNTVLVCRRGHHASRSPRRSSGWIVTYPGPVKSCDAREAAEVVPLPAGD